ncbi:MAG TPA: chemotaxis protein CheW [Chiayiivirga sp.]|jgi:twitching motility protein PilI|uniref:Chemotaxis protein CheW n=1 Tax=Denitratimonas tolerans TaxID=1338420 RepID=A0AAW9QU50_9GAMM|nr:chemotaxis protein CheW [Xanthomonadaceae bacterium]MDX9763694.1 chemotaxis protein CheW [Chiayiivirga sp.]MEB2314768.1 chemotaxis protein CheW [Xanthomonadaceae bacterium]HRN58627.1 chemotaxis protein CheW [Chiayiivirga sp.]HRO86525.1 chemotaxis protein CheW [Chiayiivirga sp.]
MTFSSATPFDILTDYERRSLTHVAGLPDQIDAPGLWRGIAFRLGAKRLAASFAEVVEIISVPPLTPVPGADTWLLGVANLRSSLLPIVDLKQYLEGERTVQHATTRALVIRQSGGNVAVLIDELLGQRNFNEGQIVAVEGVAGSGYAPFVQRAYRLGDTVWGVFDMARLTRTPEFRQAAAAQGGM